MLTTLPSALLEMGTPAATPPQVPLSDTETLPPLPI